MVPSTPYEYFASSNFRLRKDDDAKQQQEEEKKFSMQKYEYLEE